MAKSVAEFNQYVVAQRTLGKDVSLPTMLRTYMKHVQRFNKYMLREYVYRTIGNSYRSPEFDKLINSTVDRIAKTDAFSFDGAQ